MNRAGHQVVIAGGGLPFLRSVLEGDDAVADGIDDHVTKRPQREDDLPEAADLRLALGGDHLLSTKLTLPMDNRMRLSLLTAKYKVLSSSSS